MKLKNQQRLRAASAAIMAAAMLAIASSEEIPRPQFPTQEIAAAAGAGGDYILSAAEMDAVAAINRIREEHMMSGLEVDGELIGAAELKARDMAENAYFSHESPIYGSPFDLMRMRGIRYRVAGENLARGYSDGESVTAAWMASPAHRQNLLNPAFRELGIVCVDEIWCLLLRG